MINIFKKKFYIQVITILISFTIIKIFWSKIYIPISSDQTTIGEYLNNNHHAYNDTVRFFFFLLITLISYLLCIKYIYKKNAKSIKEIVNTKINSINTISRSIFFLIFILVLLIFDFLFIELPNTKLDILHEGQTLTPSFNTLITKKFYSSSYITVGFFNEILSGLIIKSMFGTFSIGSHRLFFIILKYLTKILLVLFIYKLTVLQNFSNNKKNFFFVILSFFCIYLVNNNYFSYRDLISIIFLILISNLFYSYNKKFITTIIAIGLLSSIGIFYSIDRGIFTNATTLLLIIFFILRKEYKKTFLLVSSIIFGWLFFYLVIKPNEFYLFTLNTINILKYIDWGYGIIYPEPFSSIKNSIRATRSLVLIFICGLIIIRLNFLRSKIFNNNIKVLYIFIFILSIFTYRIALGRSDGPHLIQGSALPTLLFAILILSLILNFKKLYFLNKIIIFNFKQSHFFKKVKIKIIYFFLFVTFFFLISENKNFKNINPLRFKKYISLDDKFFIDQNYNYLINELNYELNKNKQDCVQIFNYDMAIPYLLKKKTCTRFYDIFSMTSKYDENLFLNSLKMNKIKFILIDGNSIYGNPTHRLLTVNEYIKNNYTIYKIISYWKLYKLN
jgi:hypothetical protein